MMKNYDPDDKDLQIIGKAYDILSESYHNLLFRIDKAKKEKNNSIKPLFLYDLEETGKNIERRIEKIDDRLNAKNLELLEELRQKVEDHIAEIDDKISQYNKLKDSNSNNKDLQIKIEVYKLWKENYYNIIFGIEKAKKEKNNNVKLMFMYELKRATENFEKAVKGTNARFGE